MNYTKDISEHQIDGMDEIENKRFAGDVDLYMIVHKPDPELVAIFYIPAVSQLDSISKVGRLDTLYNLGILGSIKAGGMLRLNKAEVSEDVVDRIYWEPNHINNMHYIVSYFLEDYMKLEEYSLSPSVEYLDKCRVLLEKDEKYELCARIRDQIEKMKEDA